jgi:hypothetical protein
MVEPLDVAEAVRAHYEKYGPRLTLRDARRLPLKPGHVSKLSVPSWLIVGLIRVFDEALPPEVGGEDRKVLSEFAWQTLDVPTFAELADVEPHYRRLVDRLISRFGAGLNVFRLLDRWYMWRRRNIQFPDRPEGGSRSDSSQQSGEAAGAELGRRGASPGESQPPPSGDLSGGEAPSGAELTAGRGTPKSPDGAGGSGPDLDASSESGCSSIIESGAAQSGGAAPSPSSDEEEESASRQREASSASQEAEHSSASQEAEASSASQEAEHSSASQEAEGAYLPGAPWQVCQSAVWAPEAPSMAEALRCARAGRQLASDLRAFVEKTCGISGEESHRVDGRALIREMAARRVRLSNTRAKTMALKRVIVAVDDSPSCAAVVSAMYDAAVRVVKYIAGASIVIHCNGGRLRPGEVCAQDVRRVLKDETLDIWSQWLKVTRETGLVLFLGDLDAEQVVDYLLDHGRVVVMVAHHDSAGSWCIGPATNVVEAAKVFRKFVRKRKRLRL